MLLVSHDVGFAMDPVERVVVRARETRIAHGLPEEVLSDPALPKPCLGELKQQMNETFCAVTGKACGMLSGGER